MGSKEAGTKRLLRTPRPQTDESLVGYVVRLTEANYYESATWVTNLAGLKVNFAAGGWMTLNRDDTDLRPLESLTGNNYGAFDSLRYEVGRRKRTVSFKGMELPVSAVKFGRPKVCPACLREANYCRKVWDLLPFTACPAHEIILLDICQVCGERVSWVRSKVSRCRCGADWRYAPEIKASSGTLKLSRRVLELYGGVPRTMTTGEDKEPLNQLGLGDLCEAVSLFADYYRRLKEGERVTAETDNITCHETFSYAFSALEEWPYRFKEFLGEYGLGNAREAPEFKPILELHGQCKLGALDFMTVALEEFIESAASLYGGVLCEMPALSKRFVRVRELGRYFNTDSVRLQRLVRSGRIRVLRKEKGGTEETLIDLDSVAKFEEQLAASLTSADTARRLGISVASVAELVQHACLIPVSGPSVDGLPDWRFDREEPDRLLGKINAKVVGSRQRRSEVTSGEQVLRLLWKHNISTGLLVRDVLADRLVPQIMPGGNGLTQFGFSEREIENYIYAKTGVKLRNEANNTPNFRFLAYALEKRRERNERAYLSDLPRIDETTGWDRINVNDLTRIAGLVFRRAHPVYFIRDRRIF